MKKKIPNYRYRALSGRLEIDSQAKFAGHREESDNGGITSFLTPDVYIFDIPDNSKLSGQFKHNHPHLYRELNREIWREYTGV